MALYRIVRDEDTRFVIADGIEEAVRKFIHQTECSDEPTEIQLIACTDEVIK